MLEFVDEVPDGPKGPIGGKYAAVADELRNNPNKWALIQTSSNRQLAGSIKSGRIKGMSPDEFEAKSRTTSDGNFAVYVRYVGE